MNMLQQFRAIQVCLLATLISTLVAGCISPQFDASYYLDPKPARTDYTDLVSPVDKQPVYLVFDMYSAEGSFPEATRKLGPKVARTIANSRMFSTVSKVGSENMARISVSMRETAVHSAHGPKTLPAGLSSGLPGSRGVITYSFTFQFQAPGKDVVKKSYPHAVHLVDKDTTGFGDALPMTAGHAVDRMVEQAVLGFLLDLQKERKL